MAPRPPSGRSGPHAEPPHDQLPMTFRSRPVLDRKHRPRWQDELRTQQLIVVGFAIAIALALGIFGAAAWNGYWEAHLRPVAVVDGTTLRSRPTSTCASRSWRRSSSPITELQEQLPAARATSSSSSRSTSSASRLSSLTTTAADSLVDGAVLASRADDFGVSVSDDEIDAELARAARARRAGARAPHPGRGPARGRRGRRRADRGAARRRARGGAGSARAGRGRRGLRDRRDRRQRRLHRATPAAGSAGSRTATPPYDEYFDALADASAGDLVGPSRPIAETPSSSCVERREATAEGPLRRAAAQQRRQRRGVPRVRPRATPGRGVPRAFRGRGRRLAGGAAPGGPDLHRAGQRHPGPAGASAARPHPADPERRRTRREATDEQWAAAQAEAEEVTTCSRPTTPTGSRSRRSTATTPARGARRRPRLVRPGDLAVRAPSSRPRSPTSRSARSASRSGPSSATTSSRRPASARARRPRRRTSSSSSRPIPTRFAELADAGTARTPRPAADGGELGWVARYQLSRVAEDAIFALDEVGEISEPVVDAGTRDRHLPAPRDERQPRRSRRTGSTRSAPPASSAGSDEVVRTASRPGSTRSSQTSTTAA